ncbi:MAG: hypothetical protein LBM62_03865 [Mediterranea sp.]|jgi:hypothetical protein|nr:hypothetical protein [Mediterranea sp.]
MNKLYFSLSLIAALALATSCSNDDEPIQQLPEKTAGVQILLNGGGATTRTVGIPGTLATSETNINRVAIAIFTSSGQLNALEEFDKTVLTQYSSGIKTPVIACSPGTNQTIYVVANAPKGLFKNAIAPTDFTGAILSDSLITDLTPDNLPMSGTLRANGDNTSFVAGTSLTTPVTLTIGQNQTVTKTIYLSRLVTRIALKKFTNSVVTPDTLDLTDVFLYNVPTSTRTDTAMVLKTYFTPSSFMGGQIDAASTYRSTSTYLQQASWLSSAITTLPNGTDANAVWFYAFPNNNPYFPSDGVSNISYNTKLVLKGLYRTASGVSTVYYPISVNSTQGTITSSGDPYAGDGLTYRNHIYNVEATIKGAGSSSPDIDPLQTALQARIYVDNWIESTQTIEY